MIPIHKEENSAILMLNIFEKNSELSPSFICIDADSAQVILKKLKKVIQIDENLFDAEYIPFAAIFMKYDIIVLSDTLTIHHDN